MDDFLNRFSNKTLKVPETLYHYTSQKGLIGIIRNEEIWMTHTQYLNDTQEFHHAVELMRSEIESRLSNTSNGPEKNVLETMLNSINSNLSNVNICVSCFSEVGDSLSQWRAYGSKTSGFSIGFRGNFLGEISTLHNYRLVKCIYDEDLKRQAVKEFISLALDKELGRRDIGKQVEVMDELENEYSLTNTIFRFAPILKSSAFVDEKEWRIISTPLSCKLKGFDYREGYSMIIPYYKLSLAHNEMEKMESRLNEVCVGPTPNIDQSIISVRSLLISEGMPSGAITSLRNLNVEIKKSSVPYRSW